VHNLLHQIEDALPESAEVSDTCKAVRHRLRELDNEAQRARSTLNERLQEMRSSMLARLGNVGEVVESEARRTLFFRTLCSAAGLFGEKVTIVAFEVAGKPRDAECVAATARSVFQRDSDIVSRIATEVSTISIDTPDKHVLRLVAAVGEQLPRELRASCIVSIAFGTQNAQTVAEALSDASRTTLTELLASADTSR
jgi:hypothetical protein